MVASGENRNSSLTHKRGIRMKLLWVSAILLILSAPALAGPEEIIAGPYKISFDLDTAMEYDVILDPEIEDNEASWYHLAIIFDNHTKASVGITTNKDWQIGEYPCLNWQNMYLGAARDSGRIQNGIASKGVIDGKDGVIIHQEILMAGRNEAINSTIAEYWLDAVEIEGYGLMAAKTEVEMITLLPENLTDSLLETIHVEIAEPESKLTAIASEGEQNIVIRDQNDENPIGIVVIPEVTSQGPKYVVVRDRVGNVMGYQPVVDGVNRDVAVRLNSSSSNEWLHATLNKAGASKSSYWSYPFDPDSEYTSKEFYDHRSMATSSAGGRSYQDHDGKSIRKHACMDLKNNGCSESQLDFYCD
jgi:hypothetical protein